MRVIYIKGSFWLIFEKRNYSKKKHFQKFIEELGFAELSTQAKYLRVWILRDD